MRRLDSIADQMQGVVTYEFDNGRRMAFDARDLHKFGLGEMLQRAGVEPTAKREDVFQAGRKIGTVSAHFDPLAIKSTNYFYDARPGDFRHTERGWEAAAQLGPGDLDAIPDFVWADAATEEGRAARNEEDRRFLAQALAAGSRRAETPSAAQCEASQSGDAKAAQRPTDGGSNVTRD